MTVVMENGPIWGISGPAFVAAYAATLAALVIAVVIGRRRVGHRAGDAPHLRPDEYDVAMLNGGPDLVASVAVLNLRRLGVLDIGDEQLREQVAAKSVRREDLFKMAEGQAICPPVGIKADLPGDSHAIEQAAYQLVERLTGTGQPPMLGRIPLTACSTLELHRLLVESAAVAQLRADLVQRRLLCTEAQQEALRRRWLWFVPLVIVGLARVITALNSDRPLFLLVWLLGATVAIAFWTGRTAPGPTAAGQTALRELYRGHGGLLRQADDPAAALGPAGGLLLALAGTAALWSSDPALAVTLHAPPRGRTGACGACGACGGGGCGCGGCGD